MSYTQDGLNTIWHRLIGGPKHSTQPVDVSDLVNSHNLSFLQAVISANADTKQEMMFPGSVGGVTSYTDFDSPSSETTGTYARIRGNKAEEWRRCSS